MYPGGISDKIGNRYEELWTVLHFLRVLRGEHRAITVEKLGQENDGFEFHIEENDGCEKWLQSKINASGGNWTPRALHSSGVLDAFRGRLKDPTCRCLFVSQDSSHLLREACNDARVAGSLEVFKEQASQNREEALEVFSKGLVGADTEAIAFDHMKRCAFEHVSLDFVQETVEDLSSFLFQPTDHVIELAASFLLENINRPLSTEDIRNWAQSHEILKLRPDLDPTALQRLNEANQAYLTSHSSKRFGDEELDRGYAAKILESIGTGRSLVMVSGRAGSGKTIVMRQLLQRACDEGRYSLALRLDKRLDASTPQELGEVNGLPNSPVTLLARIAQGRPALLIIDQIDAVSELSGRSAPVRDALFATLREARLHSNLGCVLVCRDYDLEGDDQFRALLGEGAEYTSRLKSDRIGIEPLRWEDDVSPLLQKHGLKADLSESQKQLLSSPLNLSLYLSVDKHDFTPESQSDLFRTLLEQVQRKKPEMQMALGMEAMASWMSHRQLLRCPNQVLAPFPGLKDWLASEGLILADGRQLNFMHESLFDYVFASTFLLQEKSLLEFLKEAEQSLFRRTQVRQILQEARGIDQDWYLRNLRDILNSDEVRTHIELSVAKWLSQLSDPTAIEYDIILATDDPGQFFSLTVSNAFLGSTVWIPLLAERGFIQEALVSPVEERSGHAFWWFARNAGYFPELAANIMRDWWGGDPDNANSMVNWFGLVDRKMGDKALADLLIEVLVARPPNLFTDDQDRLGMLLNSWVETNPEQVDLILSEFMACWFDAHPNAYPFTYDAIKHSDLYHFGKLAEKNPSAFARGILPTLLRTLDVLTKGMIQAIDFIFPIATERDWKTFYRLLFLLLKHWPMLILSSVKNCSFNWTLSAIQSFSIFGWFVLKRAPEQLGRHLEMLSKCEDLLSCGYDGAKYLPFAEAARALAESGTCCVEEIEALFTCKKPEQVRALRDFQSWKDARGEKDNKQYRSWAVDALNNNGRFVWNVMNAIGKDHLSDNGLKVFYQLERKFGPSVAPMPRAIRMRHVISPLSKDVAERMTDEQWLSAIRKYDRDDWRGEETEETIEGGARELSLVCVRLLKGSLFALATCLENSARSISFLFGCPVWMEFAGQKKSTARQLLR